MAIRAQDQDPRLKIDEAMKMLASLENRTGDSSSARDLRKASKRLLDTGMHSLVPMLPLLLNLKGHPYTLDDHFPFEPFFATHMARNLLLKTGRQVSKSTSLAAQGILLANCLAYFNTLYVTPLFEMIRRFSNNYVRGFIEQSPVKKLWCNTETNSNVLQRSFTNHSNMFFSFAFLDADRTRGLNCDKVAYDEVQDMDETFIPIIRETMSGSPWGGIQQYAGTPKTLDNTIEKLWTKSSQAEWMVPCLRCGYENIPAMDYDLDEMIGPWHPGICEETPGTICAKCKRPVNPRSGFWVHADPKKVGDFSGYHVPQIIMPMHYADKDKWQLLVGKREGWFGTPANVFYNEVCGESYDTGAKLVTITELKAAAKLNNNTIDDAVSRIGNYTTRILAVDWGGGGAEGVSFTTYAVLCMAYSGEIHCIYGYRSMTPHDFNREAQLCLELMGKFNCSHLVHDYTGAGAYREKFVIDSGLPIENVVPVWYVAAASQAMFRFVAATDQHPRNHYKCDKARSLILTCSQIKNGQLQFFADDYQSDDRPGLIRDFLALVEEKTDNKRGRDDYRIIRQQNMSDDFAQAVNIGCMTLYHMTNHWPNLAEIDNYRIDQSVIDACSPVNPDWN